MSDAVYAHNVPLVIHATYEPDLDWAFVHTRCRLLLWIRKIWLSPAANGTWTDQDVSCMACIAAGTEP